jgi:hypothetical protein
MRECRTARWTVTVTVTAIAMCVATFSGCLPVLGVADAGSVEPLSFQTFVGKGGARDDAQKFAHIPSLRRCWEVKPTFATTALLCAQTVTSIRTPPARLRQRPFMSRCCGTVCPWMWRIRQGTVWRSR